MSMTRGERNDLMSVARKSQRRRWTRVLPNCSQTSSGRWRRSTTTTMTKHGRRRLRRPTQRYAMLMTRSRTAARRSGFPPSTGPVCVWEWYGRGQNGVEQRQAELRRVAKSRIRQIAESAKHRIEAEAANVQERILTTGLGEEAREALQGMPTPEQLMPLLDVIELENAVSKPALGPGL